MSGQDRYDRGKTNWSQLGEEVERARQGDRDALERVCRLFRPLVLSQARSPRVRQVLGEDGLGIVWLAFLEVVLKRQPPPTDNLAGYLAAKLKYAVREELEREVAHRARLCLAEEVELLTQGPEEPPQGAEGQEGGLLLELELALVRLRPRERLLLRKVLLEDYSHQQLAAATGLGEAAVRKAYGRALEKLRAALAEQQ